MESITPEVQMTLSPVVEELNIERNRARRLRCASTNVSQWWQVIFCHTLLVHPWRRRRETAVMRCRLRFVMVRTARNTSSIALAISYSTFLADNVVVDDDGRIAFPPFLNNDIATVLPSK